MRKTPCKVGDKFGEWEVFSKPRVELRYKKKQTVVDVRCSCGEERDIILCLLSTGRSKKCAKCAIEDRGYTTKKPTVRKICIEKKKVRKVVPVKQPTPIYPAFQARDGGVCHSNGECVDYGMCGDRMFQCACGGHIKPRNGHENFRGDAY